VASDLSHQRLLDQFGVKTILCKGYSIFYPAQIEARQIHEEFLTISPVNVGSKLEQYRPGLLDGTAFQPGNDYGVQLNSLRRRENMLFLRSRY
jgi:hypothetical protein